MWGRVWKSGGVDRPCVVYRVKPGHPHLLYMNASETLHSTVLPVFVLIYSLFGVGPEASDQRWSDARSRI